jgi:hypothetical protein
MKIERRDKDSTASAPDDKVLEMTGAEKEAAAFLAHLEDTLARLPWLRKRHGDLTNSVRANRTVTKKFLLHILAMAESVPELQQAARFDPAWARAVLQRGDAFHPVVVWMEHLYLELRYTLEAERHELVRSALQLYTIAQALDRDSGPEDGKLHGALEQVQRQIRPSRRRKKAKTPEGGGE